MEAQIYTLQVLACVGIGVGVAALIVGVIIIFMLASIMREMHWRKQ